MYFQKNCFYKENYANQISSNQIGWLSLIRAHRKSVPPNRRKIIKIGVVIFKLGTACDL